MITYAKAGVDILKKDSAIRSLVSAIKFRRRGIGRPLVEMHYAGIIDIPGKYAIGITTDGVGSKILVASEMKKWDTIGIDCIAMNVNDLLAMGIEPVAFVDYLAFQSPSEEIAREIGKGLEKGARIARISIVGGETATLPDMIRGLDLAGTCIGIVEKRRIITGRRIRVGDAVIGMRSSGIHSNGLTLARKVVENAGYSYHDPFPPNPKISIGMELLRPTRIYMEVLELVRKCEVHGLAHITGSGFLKLRRITKYGFDINDPIKPHPIFKFIQDLGNVEDAEMYRTFNMGMGFACVVPDREVEKALRILGRESKVVGEICREPKIDVGGVRVG